MDRREFSRQMEERVGEVEEMLGRFLPHAGAGEAGMHGGGDAFQKTVFEAMEYSLMAGGKRLRPIFILEAYRLFGGEEDAVVEAFMAAMEMIHTYSLVHDDLPAMDNDDFRRGKPTTHKVFGEDMGILAGDALLNFAYETAIRGVGQARNKENAVHALQILSEKAGVFGMVGGQVVDVEMTGKPLADAQVDFIYRLKTGALLEASLMAGAMLAGATEEQVAQMERIGSCIGMAFQIQDDILDVTSTTEELGKPVGSDEKNEKMTYVTIHGMEAAKEKVEEYSGQALELLEGLPGENPFLNTLILELIHRKK